MRRAETMAAVAALALLGSGCASVSIPEVVGGEPFELAPSARDEVGLRYVMVQATDGVILRYDQATDPDHSVDVVDAEAELALESDLRAEITQELERCATGDRKVDVTVLVDRLTYDERLGSLVDGNGVDEVAAVVEFVAADSPDPSVLGRYRVSIGARSGNAFERILGSRISQAGEELGRALCMQAFGRNPRPPAIQNSTR